MVEQLENASEGFHQASRIYAQASRDIETVQAGRQAATRGRSEDVISAYQALRPEAQAAFRSRHVGVERTRSHRNEALAYQSDR